MRSDTVLGEIYEKNYFKFFFVIFLYFFIIFLFVGGKISTLRKLIHGSHLTSSVAWFALLTVVVTQTSDLTGIRKTTAQT